MERADKKGGRRVGRPPGPGPDHEARRSQLLDAATTVIRREGADASMDQLAAEAELTKPILYTYFRDKAGLAEALAERVATELGATLLQALTEVTEPRDVVRATIASWVNYVEAEPNLYAFLVQGAAGTGRGLSRQRLVTNVGNSVAMVLGGGLHRVGIDMRLAEPWAFGIVGAVVLTTDWWRERGGFTRDELVEHLTTLVWDGVGGAGLNRLEGPLLPQALAAAMARQVKERK